MSLTEEFGEFSQDLRFFCMFGVFETSEFVSNVNDFINNQNFIEEPNLVTTRGAILNRAQP